MDAYPNSIRDTRVAAGLSQAQLARSCNVSQQYISRVEAGWHMPTVAVRNQIESALHSTSLWKGIA